MSKLSESQVDGIKKLINDEVARNVAEGNDAYNTYWENILVKLDTLDISDELAD